MRVHESGNVWDFSEVEKRKGCDIQQRGFIVGFQVSRHSWKIIRQVQFSPYTHNKPRHGPHR